jgi:putative membrane-bound dehydrogenase-like protein
LLSPATPPGADTGAFVVSCGLRVPAGFEVIEFADDRLATNIYTLTFDAQQRVFVSGPGYVRLLVDEDGDGRADRAVVFAEAPRDGAMGLLWEKDTLYLVGDGGLRRLRDRDGDGHADGPAELLWPLRTDGEHTAHALRRGADGWLYLVCGDRTDLDKLPPPLPTSPLRKAIGGAVLRFAPDWQGYEIVADGFRNPYSMDFAADGELFTFDSDNERCVSLPWYEPTRWYHVVPGGHYGWLTPQHARYWRLPPYFCDVVPPVATFGRGSPTGVVCYRQRQFPSHYWDGFFLLDWTFGRIYFVRLQQQGSSYTCQAELFAQAVGEGGFAPTGIAVQPSSGDLFVCTGGRGTHGAVYRIHYSGVQSSATPPAPEHQTPRPLWTQDGQSARVPDLLALSQQGTPAQRFQALSALRRQAAHLKEADLLRAALANWQAHDRLLRRAAADLLACLPPQRQRALRALADQPEKQITLGLALAETAPEQALSLAVPLLGRVDLSEDLRLAAVRLLQLALGDLVAPAVRTTVWEGYTLRRPAAQRVPALHRAALAACRAAFPSGRGHLDRELSRTLAALEDSSPHTLQQVAEQLATVEDPVEQTHYLIVLARLSAPRSSAITARTAQVLLALDRQLQQRHAQRDTNWPLRLRELYLGLCARDPALAETLLQDPEFGRPDHVLFVPPSEPGRQQAARRFLERARADRTFVWNAALVRLAGALPPAEGLPVLRPLWQRADLRPALLPLLARQPVPEDRPRFLEVLNTASEPETLSAALAGLERLPEPTPAAKAAESAALVAALVRLPAGPSTEKLRQDLVRRLQQQSGARLGSDPAAWRRWLERTQPQAAARLNNPDGVDLAAWELRRRRLDWTRGQAARGQAVFVKAGCAACHSGSGGLGPDLRGVTRRFSRDDLLTAIVQPSKDISPRYRATWFETRDGRTWMGLVIYESADGVLLQTASGPVRLAAAQIAHRQPANRSLMPAGLLDPLSDQEIVDLYAYLQSLEAGDAGVRRSAR